MTRPIAPLFKSDLPNPIGTINYMIGCFYGSDEHSFLGFMPIIGEHEHWGVEIDGLNYAAVHLCKFTGHWGSDIRDTAALAETQPWVLMFLGSDNTSYFERFASWDNAVSYFNEIEAVDTSLENLMYYNS